MAEVLASAKKVTGKPIPRSYGARRARSELGWTPRFHELETLIEHAWAWEQKVAAS